MSISGWVQTVHPPPFSVYPRTSATSLFPSSSLPFRLSTPCTANPVWRNEKEGEKGDGGFYEAGHQPVVNVLAGTDGISADEEKENAPPSSLTSLVDLGVLNKMDVLGSRIERNCTVDSLKCHRRRRHGLLDGATTLMRRNRTRLISTDPIWFRRNGRSAFYYDAYLYEFFLRNFLFTSQDFSKTFVSIS